MEDHRVAEKTRFASEAKADDDARGASSSSSDKESPPATTALRELVNHFHGLTKHAQLILKAEWDGCMLRVRRTVLVAAMCVAAASVMLAVLTATLIALLFEVASALGEWAGDRPWVGHLIVSLTVVLLVMGTGLWGWTGFHRRRLQRTMTKYQHENRNDAE